MTPSSSALLIAMPDEDTLGGRLVRAREARALSIGDVANQLGVKRETVAAWESDRSEPRINRLVMLAGILGVSPTWLISGRGLGVADEEEPDSPAIQPAVETTILELRRLYAETGRTIERLEAEMRAAQRG